MSTVGTLMDWECPVGPEETVYEHAGLFFTSERHPLTCR